MTMTGDYDDLNPCDEMYGSPHKELSVSRPGILFFFRIFLYLVCYLLEKVHFHLFRCKSEFWTTGFTVISVMTSLSTSPTFHIPYGRLSA